MTCSTCGSCRHILKNCKGRTYCSVTLARRNPEDRSCGAHETNGKRVAA